MNRIKAPLLIVLVLLFAACRDSGEEPTKMVTPSPVQVQATATISSTEESVVEEESTAIPEEPADPAPAKEAEEVILEAVDGQSVVSTFYPGTGDGPRQAVILLHMNGEIALTGSRLPAN